MGFERNDIVNRSSVVILVFAALAGLQGCAQGEGSLFGRGGGGGASQLSSSTGSPTAGKPSDGPASRSSTGTGGYDAGVGDMPGYGSTRGAMRPGS